LESVAFHVPCITTSLAGFGLWANKVKGSESELLDGVKTVCRSDYNFEVVANTICDTILEFTLMDDKTISKVRKKAAVLAEKALWKNFIKYYYQAYDIALTKRNSRVASDK
jgi:hypothetical protein